MILYLPPAFLLRLKLIWQPDLTGFLLGDRNFYFFSPDTFVQVPEISVSEINSFLKEKMANHPEWELLGFLSNKEAAAVPGYVQVVTGGSIDPEKWVASLFFIEDSRPVAKRLQIKLPAT